MNQNRPPDRALVIFVFFASVITSTLLFFGLWHIATVVAMNAAVLVAAMKEGELG